MNISNNMVLKRIEGFYCHLDLTVWLCFTLAEGTVASFATLYFNRYTSQTQIQRKKNKVSFEPNCLCTCMLGLCPQSVLNRLLLINLLEHLLVRSGNIGSRKKIHLHITSTRNEKISNLRKKFINLMDILKKRYVHCYEEFICFWIKVIRSCMYMLQMCDP